MSWNRVERVPLERRFWKYVVLADSPGCWEWIGARSGPGYGVINEGGRGRILLAHRVAYEMLVGPIPEGLTIDHLCRVRHCVNPAHMEPVTLAENLRRRLPPPSHCPHGHEFTPENTRRYSGSRLCVTCKRQRDRDYRKQRAS